MPTGVPQHDPFPPNGPLSQLLAALWRALFAERWAPFARLILAAVVAVGLYLAIQIYG